MIRKPSGFQLSYASVPLFLLVLCVLAHGLKITQLGFYWDDWAKLLVNWLYGASGYWSYYLEDRPLSSWTHLVLNPLLGYSPLRWHVFVLGLRWLTAVGMWWAMKGLFPSLRHRMAIAAALFVVYPIFTMQPMAVTFHQMWLQYALFFVSLGATVYAVRHPKALPYWTLLAVVAMILQLTISEYFAPLEGLRLVALWLLLSPQRDRFSHKLFLLLRYYGVYFVVFLLYSIRLFLTHLPGDHPYSPNLIYSFFSQPAATIPHLVKVGILETYHILVGSWSEVIRFGVSGVPRSPHLQSSWWLAALVFAVMVMYFLLLKPSPSQDEASSPSTVQIAAVGLLSVILGVLPAWLSGRQVLDDYHANRYAAAAMFGASLFWASVTVQLLPRRLYRAAVVAVLLALAAATHYRNSAEYADLWQQQIDFYWQLTWRAPHIQAGTALLFEREVFPNQGLFSTSSAINFLYPQPKNPPQLAYWLYLTRPALAQRYQNGETINFNTRFRSFYFEASPPNSLIVYYNPGWANCVWILTPEDADNPDLTAVTRQMISASSPSRIEPQAAAGYPPVEIFGVEPQRGFCYHYQKAELARQQGDWEAVAEQADAVVTAAYYPEAEYYHTPQEWLTFIEGYAHTARWEEAVDLTLAARHIGYGRYRQRFCNLWQRIEESAPARAEKANSVGHVRSELTCDDLP